MSSEVERQLLRVIRTGGIAGLRRSGELDLAGDDPRVPEVSELLGRCDLAALPESPPQPDRYRFEFHTPQLSATLGEQDMNDDLTPPRRTRPRRLTPALQAVLLGTLHRRAERGDAQAEAHRRAR